MANTDDSFTPSPQQQDLLDAVRDPRGGNIILVAVAGAGKTFTLVKACELMTGSVFLGAYNTKMAKELRDKTAHLSKVKAGTFHSAGYGAVRYYLGNKLQKDISGNKVRDICDNFVETRGRKDLEKFVPFVCGAVSMAKQRGIGPIFPNNDDTWYDMIDHFGLDDNLPEESEEEPRLDQLVAFSKVVLELSNRQAQDEGIIDFDDMVYLPLLWNLRMFPNDWVLIDEAQDTNPTRRALAKKMLKRGGRLIAVGDPRQAIYGFSGADNNALDQIKRDFNAKEMPLTVTYRCPKSVVAVAQQFVSHIEAHETAPEGEATAIEYEELPNELRPGDAVLCRYNKYLVSLCFKLIREGRPARIEGRAIGQNLAALCSKWKVKKIDTLSSRIQRWRDREVKKAQLKKQDAKVDQIEDKAETVLVMIARAREQGIDTVAGLKEMILSLFDDNVVNRDDMITLCSVHRSKGLEWDRVFILGLFELMGRECRQQWQTIQEENLQYVAATRSQGYLADVLGVREEAKQHNEEELADDEEEEMA